MPPAWMAAPTGSLPKPSDRQPAGASHDRTVASFRVLRRDLCASCAHVSRSFWVAGLARVGIPDNLELSLSGGSGKRVKRTSSGRPNAETWSWRISRFKACWRRVWLSICSLTLLPPGRFALSLVPSIAHPGGAVCDRSHRAQGRARSPCWRARTEQNSPDLNGRARSLELQPPFLGL